jgi:hypothetical protein
MSLKLQVVQYAEKHGKRPASCKFYMNEQCVREWCKQNKRLEIAPKSKQGFCGKQSTFPQIENELYAYVVSGYAVYTVMLQLEASQIA